jgi:glucose-6-phosphate 1-dehydrogenase
MERYSMLTADVPFILKCGKALNEQKAEIRIQFKDVSSPIFPARDLARNELVIRLQPNEAIYMKIVSKQPGLKAETVISELDLTYKMRYSEIRIPDAYESLILDVLNGDHSNFVRDDELEAAWAIFTPALKELDQKNPTAYEYGSRGPVSADSLIESVGFSRPQKEYVWKDTKL